MKGEEMAIKRRKRDKSSVDPRTKSDLLRELAETKHLLSLSEAAQALANQRALESLDQVDLAHRERDQVNCDLVDRCQELGNAMASYNVLSERFSQLVRNNSELSRLLADERRSHKNTAQGLAREAIMGDALEDLVQSLVAGLRTQMDVVHLSCCVVDGATLVGADPRVVGKNFSGFYDKDVAREVSDKASAEDADRKLFAMFTAMNF